ncbi:hypothetical protein SISNIDRAFT_491694 [Sistotremastrum niveocremeum HHB9708]|uniref:Uncharacterized protein n=1 Tax=Sistotremastrum niveocremeum HHB9708 TaxID=1314777 RepID=A0A164MI82_9AGAM|nr:hypothetical protein SISNIDRAFT_491694 [Sistotremastrum niveocremeum HHB9708]
MLTSAAVQPVLARPHLHPPYSPPWLSPRRRPPPSTTSIQPPASSQCPILVSTPSLSLPSRRTASQAMGSGSYPSRLADARSLQSMAITDHRLPYDIALPHQHHHLSSLIPGPEEIKTARSSRANILSVSNVRHSFSFNLRSSAPRHRPPPSTYRTSILRRCTGIQNMKMARTSVQICHDDVLRRWEIRAAGLEVTVFRHHRHSSTHPSSNDIPLLDLSTVVTLSPLDILRPRHPLTAPPPLEDPPYETRTLKYGSGSMGLGLIGLHVR